MQSVCPFCDTIPNSFEMLFIQKSFIDPTLEYDLTSSKPWALSPLLATMPHFAHERIYSLDGLSQSDIPPFPPSVSISDDTSQLWAASTCSIRQPRSCDVTPPSLSRTSFSTSWSSSSDTSHYSAKSSLRDNVNYTLRRSLEKAHIRWKGTTHDMDFRTPGERRSFFASAQHRQEVVLGPQVCLFLFWTFTTMASAWISI